MHAQRIDLCGHLRHFVQCRMQGPEGASFKSPLHCLRMGLRTEGPRFLARGFLATCAREVPGNAIFFSAYETLRYALSPSAPPPPTRPHDPPKHSKPALGAEYNGSLQASGSSRPDPLLFSASDRSSSSGWLLESSPSSQTQVGSGLGRARSVDGLMSSPALQNHRSSSDSSTDSIPGMRRVDMDVKSQRTSGDRISSDGEGGTLSEAQQYELSRKGSKAAITHFGSEFGAQQQESNRNGSKAAAAAAEAVEGNGSDVDLSNSKGAGWKESFSARGSVSSSSQSMGESISSSSQMSHSSLSSNGPSSSSPSSSGGPGFSSALSAILSGGVSGMLMWSLVLPIDVAKTRLQTASPGSPWDAGVVAHLRMLWR
ncbi:hypothetical protein DUNSADRAFT_2160 [Dunaliella salina]|nr:hypothetical protein DUNSADRAFT_2160 [Dunaliella salina]|eukprot:KAF5843124.1 hypothetical protein DUNSADRAFT_2160 [Dunaliella salina]